MSHNSYEISDHPTYKAPPRRKKRWWLILVGAVLGYYAFDLLALFQWFVLGIQWPGR